MNKKRVAVLFGGVSSEHEVSRMSVTSVLQNIDRSLYEPLAVGITKAGRWFYYDGPVQAILDGSWEKLEGHRYPCVLSPDRGHHGLLIQRGGFWEQEPVDIVFPMLHGRNGEDGTVQGLCQLAGIPFVGCGVLASACCMDKDVAKQLFTAAGIPNAHWISVLKYEYRTDELHMRIQKELRYPVFVKPANAGSSVGVSKVSNLGELIEAMDAAFAHDFKVIIEETISGAEVECSVMGNAHPTASDMVGEIVPLRGLYDYEGKYVDGTAQLNIPAHITEAQSALVRELAVKVYRALGCTGLARIDFFALGDGERVILNEINTLPGFTSISMYPKLFIASGLSYGELITKLITFAEERRNG